jgi:hypothetical protein
MAASSRRLAFRKLSSWQAQAIVRRLGGLSFVGMDVVEVAPPYDVAEITALAAATMVFEYLALIVRPPRSPIRLWTRRRQRRHRAADLGSRSSILSPRGDLVPRGGRKGNAGGWRTCAVAAAVFRSRTALDDGQDWPKTFNAVT